jgi:tRNA(His) guanylyltransferase
MDSLGDRMKENYENRNRTYLLRRTPVIIRVDGKAFHTLTNSCRKPYDSRLISTMALAAADTAKELQGFKLGYVQSDEASFLLTDFDSLDTQAWFSYNVQKMCSIAASLMTFNFRRFTSNGDPWAGKYALFDARCFNIPKEEVTNYFLWRAQDWGRNSIQMLAQAHFSPKELHGKNQADMHEMLHTKGLNWADEPSVYKNGTFIYKNDNTISSYSGIRPKYEEVNIIVNQVMPKEN